MKREAKISSAHLALSYCKQVLEEDFFIIILLNLTTYPGGPGPLIGAIFGEKSKFTEIRYPKP
jgi:hypothetical protein